MEDFFYFLAFGGLFVCICLNLIWFVWLLILSVKLKRLKETLDLDQDTQFKNKIEETENCQNVETKEVRKKQFVLSQEGEKFHWENFFGKNFFAIFGSVSVVLSLMFFTVWTISNGYIGPMGQVSIGVIVALGFLIGGEIMRSRNIRFFEYISAVGFAGLIGITFVARVIYNFLTPEQAFIAFCLEVVTALILAIRYDSRVLGNAGIVGGLLTPLLVQSPTPNATGLLTFLTILSVGGFWVSLQKQWSEIIVILFFGVVGFEIGILEQDLLKFQPFVFLAFITGLHLVLGSGGIIREILARSKEISKSAMVDTITFVSSVLIANILAYVIFAQNLWEHFGFIVLAQGFLMYLLADYLEKKGLRILRNIAIAETLASIIFATLWELGGGDNTEFILTVLLAGESILFTLSHRKTQDIVFEIFAKIANFLAICCFLMYVDYHYSIVESVIALVIVLFANFLAVKNLPDNKYKKVISVISFIISSIIFLVWSFEIFSKGIVSDNSEWFLFVLLMFWGLLFTYGAKLKKLPSLAYWGALGFFVVVNLIFWVVISFSYSFYNKFGAFVAVMTGSFLTLYELNKDELILKNSRKFVNFSTYLFSAICTISIIVFADVAKIFEYLVLWLALWGAGLLFIGANKKLNSFRYTGIAVVILALGKLYLVDVWDFDEWLRVVAFGAIGVGLLVISFLYNKYKK